MNLKKLLRLKASIPSGPKNLLPLSIFEGNSYYTVNGNVVTVNKSDDRGWSSLTAFPMKAGKYTLTKSNTKFNICVRTSADSYGSNFILESKGTISFTLDEDCELKIKLNKGNETYPFDTELSIVKA